MDNFWIGRFVRITNPLSDTYGQRGQVVAETGHNVTVRFADGSHQTRGMGTVAMDPDQTTPVWPPVLPISVNSFVRCCNPTSIYHNQRGIVRKDSGEFGYDVQWFNGLWQLVAGASIVLDDDQTTPLDGGA